MKGVDGGYISKHVNANSHVQINGHIDPVKQGDIGVL